MEVKEVEKRALPLGPEKGIFGIGRKHKSHQSLVDFGDKTLFSKGIGLFVKGVDIGSGLLQDRFGSLDYFLLPDRFDLQQGVFLFDSADGLIKISNQSDVAQKILIVKEPPVLLSSIEELV